MPGILLVSGIGLLCSGIFFNEFILPGLIRRHNAQESDRDVPKQKEGHRSGLD